MSRKTPGPGRTPLSRGPTEAEFLAALRLVTRAERRKVMEAEQLLRDARRMLDAATAATADADRRRSEAERVVAEAQAEGRVTQAVDERVGPALLGPPAVFAVDLVATAATAVLLAMVGLGVTGPLRLALALGFVTFVPGWAMLGHTRIVRGTSAIALSVAVSLTLCVGTAVAMAWRRAWHPVALFDALAGGSLVVLAWRAARGPDAAGFRSADDAVASVPAIRLVSPSAPALAVALAPPPLAAVPPSPREMEPVVDPERLRLSHVAVRVEFATRAPFAVQELTDLFAGLHERHPFADLHLDGVAGAVMETASRRLEVRQGSAEYCETVTTRLCDPDGEAGLRDPDGGTPFERAKRNAVDVLAEVQRRLGLSLLDAPTCRVRADWRPEHAGDISGLFPGAGHATGLLRSTLPVTMELRLAGRSEQPSVDWDVVVGPARAGHLAVEVITKCPTEVEGPGAIGDHLQQAHDFLTGTVVGFLECLPGQPVDGG